jgi:large subunit ribosomal protein L20
MRVTNAVARKARHNKLFKLVKGFKWGRKNVYRLALNAAAKSGQNSYRDRKRKKRTFRQLWIIRISAALRAQGKRYSEFAFKLAQKQIIVNRKMLSELAVNDSATFNAIVEKAYA